MASQKLKYAVCAAPTIQSDAEQSKIVIARLLNYVKAITEELNSGSIEAEPAVMANTDALFAIETILRYQKHRVISTLTKEKKRHERRLISKCLFLDTLEKDGGVYNSLQAAKILGKTKTTVKNWKDANQLLAIEIDGDFFYPVFQFTDNEDISVKGVLKGVSELLPLLGKFSDRLQYSFFMEKRTTRLKGLQPERQYTVAEILKENPGESLMEELRRLARNYASQDAA